MKAIINYVKGFHTSRKTVTMVLFLLVFNLLFSLILAVPMYTSLENSIGRSEAGDRIAQGFDYIWWEEYRDQSEGIETTFTPSIIGKGAVLDNFVHLIQFGNSSLPGVFYVLGAFYVLVHTFLSGGIISIFSQVKPSFSIKGFLSGSGKFASRFFLLMIFSWLFFFLVISLKNIISPLINRVSSTANSEILPFYLSLILSILIYVLFLFFQMVFDYARIKTVITDNQNILQTTKDSFLFVLRNIGSTMGLFYLLLLTNLALSVIYILIHNIIPQSSFPGVAFAFLIQQVFIGSFIWIRCWLYSSQMELYKYLN